MPFSGSHHTPNDDSSAASTSREELRSIHRRVSAPNPPCPARFQCGSGHPAEGQSTHSQEGPVPVLHSQPADSGRRTYSIGATPYVPALRSSPYLQPPCEGSASVGVIACAELA